MGTVDFLGVEPDVALKGLLAGEQVVLHVVLPHRDAQPGGGAELHGLWAQPAALVLPLDLSAEISRVRQLLADLLQVPFPLGQGDVLQHAVQIVQLPPTLLQLNGQHLFCRFRLVVFLIILRRVLLGGEQGVQFDLHLAPLRVIKIHGPQRGHAALHGVKVRGNDVPELAQPLPVLGGLQLPLLIGELPGGAVPGVGDGTDQILALLADALLILPLLIEAVHQSGECGIGGALPRLFILLRREKGEVFRPLFNGDHSWRKAIFPHSLQQRFRCLAYPNPALGTQLIKGHVHPAPGPKGDLPADQRRPAAKGVQQPVIHPALPRGLLHPAKPLSPIQGGGVGFFHGGGQTVEQTGQQLPLGGHIPVHPAQAVHDAALVVHQHQIGPAAHGL